MISTCINSRSVFTSAIFMFLRSVSLRFLIILAFVLTSCGVSKKLPDQEIKLTYLDDIVLERNNAKMEFGGISGIDLQNDTLYMISDRGRSPGIFISRIKVNAGRMFVTEPQLYLDLEVPDDDYYDLESINKLEDGKGFILSSEGNIKKRIAPSIFRIDKQGNRIREFTLPASYQMENGTSAVVHNRAIEAVSYNKENNTFWFATEFPLKSEGKPPKLFRSGDAQTFLHYDIAEERITARFEYQLDPIPKLPLLPYALNGLTGMLRLGDQHLITVERGFSAGWGKHSNRVKLFLVRSNGKLANLEDEAVEKYLLLDLKNIKKEMNADRIDNIEGICQGPRSADGSRTILLISDDNFDAYNDQITQLIWLKVETEGNLKF